MELESKILLDTIKLQHLFIESLYDIKRKDYYIALHKLEEAYNLFDDLIQIVHPLSDIRVIIIGLRDKIEYNMKQIKGYTYDSSPIDIDIIYDKDIVDEINNDYPIHMPSLKNNDFDLFTYVIPIITPCITPIINTVNPIINCVNTKLYHVFNTKVKVD